MSTSRMAAQAGTRQVSKVVKLTIPKPLVKRSGLSYEPMSQSQSCRFKSDLPNLGAGEATVTGARNPRRPH